MDVALAIIIGLLTWPLMLLTALTIKLDSRGAIFYLQERVGLHNTTFRIVKFDARWTPKRTARFGPTKAIRA